MNPLAVFVLIFLAVGAGFVLINMLVGKLFRPRRPGAEKGTIYECGEPTIGSAWVQFDLRYYVIALLFVIFDVEVAFFFPWAEVFGKAAAVAQVGTPRNAEAYHEVASRAEALARTTLPQFSDATFGAMKNLTAQDLARLSDLRGRVRSFQALTPDEVAEFSRLEAIEQQANGAVSESRTTAWLALVEILVFFGLLLLGFAYLWRRGDLAWVRSLPDRQPVPESGVAVMVEPREAGTPTQPANTR
jgi:NADH-quinone oxidoreductase subunit A